MSHGMKREQECRISMMEGLSMQAKERVYESLKESCSNNGKITAAELAQKLVEYQMGDVVLMWEKPSYPEEKIFYAKLVN